MDTQRRALAYRIWRELAARNQWQLFDGQEDELLAAVLADPATAEGAERAIRAALQGRYSRRLYEGIGRREERAAYELWLLFVRLAVRDGVSEQDAGDLAQEALARLLQKLGQVNAPHAFLAWAMMLFRTTQRDLRPGRVEQSLPTEDAAAPEPADPHDLVAAAEDRLIAQEFRDRLRAAVPNALERLTLLRCVVIGDDPRDVARDLSLPLHRTRVAKSRALQRLRADAAFMAFVRSLDPSREAAPATGGQSHA